MSATPILLSETALRRLREMAEWSEASLEATLEKAVADQYDRQFWEAVNKGYDALRADPQAWAEEEAERKLWENTLMDGLDPTERWNEDGTVAAPADQWKAS
jgi:hypothetical protein